jgi:hypothetical protein
LALALIVRRPQADLARHHSIIVSAINWSDVGILSLTRWGATGAPGSGTAIDIFAGARG